MGSVTDTFFDVLVLLLVLLGTVVVWQDGSTPTMIVVDALVTGLVILVLYAKWAPILKEKYNNGN